VPNIAGAAVGAIILLSTPESAFDVLVPFLILFACVLLAFQDGIGGYTAHHRAAFAASGRMPWPVFAAMFVLGIYGAYFGAALGIMTLAVFALFLVGDLQQLNALKGMSSLIINAIAVVWFALFGPVEWAPVAVMAVGAILGGYFGVGIARRMGRDVLRAVVIAYGVVVAAVLFVQLFV
jgi:uncharacterized membrane protein YfcA